MYRIANINIKIVNVNLPDVWNKFKYTGKDKRPQNIEITVIENISNFSGFDLLSLDSEWRYLIKIETEVMLVDQLWEKALILPTYNSKLQSTFFLQVYYAQAIKRKTIQCHSSLINYKGHGFMFLGPSGIGKTTQAELWKQYKDALIINGDVVFVQETDKSFLGWGTSWHGSSPYCENANVPVDALIILKQAPENSIRKLEGFEKVTAVSNSVFYPRWLENGMELCLETLDHLLSKIPVYELSCRPDEEAVELTEKTIFGREN